MAKDKKPAPQRDERAERDRLIDEATEARLTGGADEGAAWAKALGGNVQESESGDAAPLTADEKAAVRDLMIHAAETGDTESLDLLQKLAADPAALRKALADFDPQS